MQRAGGVREVRGAFAFQVRHQHDALGAGGRGESERAEFGQVDAQHAGGRVQHAGGVERARQRQVAARGVGEPRDDAGRVGCPDVAGRGDDAGRAERDEDLRARAHAEDGCRVVTGARPEAVDRLGGPEDSGQHDVGTAQGEFEQVRRVRVADRVEVAGAGGVRAVGEELGQVLGAAQPPRQPVVRQADGGGALGVGRFVLGQPAQLRDRERRDRHQADPRGPLRRAQLGGQRGGGRCGPGVVPQQRVPHDLAVLVEAHHAVLLARHAHRGDVVQTAGLDQRGLQRGPPVRRVDRRAVRVGRAALPDELTGLRLAHDDLARLRRGVDARDERHVSAPRRGARARAG